MCCYKGEQPDLTPFVQQEKSDNALELAIHCVKDCLSHAGCDMSNIGAAEWWAHKRAPTDAHQLHADLDETRIGSGAAKYKLTHPVRRRTQYKDMLCCKLSLPQEDHAYTSLETMRKIKGLGRHPSWAMSQMPICCTLT